MEKDMRCILKESLAKEIKNKNNYEA